MRSALEMLERARYGCNLPGSDDLAPSGPINEAYAIGWAKSALRRALGLSNLPADQPKGNYGR